MAVIMAVASGKGGVGKTTVVANLGIKLAQQGFNVCLVDADVAMANLSLILGMQAAPITLHDVLLGQSSVDDAIYDGPGGVKVVPSGLSLESYRKVDPERLRAVMESLRTKFDYVLVDVAAGIERTVTAALAACDNTMLVTMPDPPSIADVLKIRMTAQGLGSKPIGVIINFVRKEKGEIEEEDIMKMLELPAYGIIPYDPEIRKTFLEERAKPVVLRKPTAPSSIAFGKAADRISGRIEIEAGKAAVAEAAQKSAKKQGGGIGSILSSFARIFSGRKRQMPSIEKLK